MPSLIPPSHLILRCERMRASKEASSGVRGSRRFFLMLRPLRAFAPQFSSCFRCAGLRPAHMKRAQGCFVRASRTRCGRAVALSAGFACRRAPQYEVGIARVLLRLDRSISRNLRSSGPAPARPDDDGCFWLCLRPPLAPDQVRATPPVNRGRKNRARFPPP